MKSTLDPLGGYFAGGGGGANYTSSQGAENGGGKGGNGGKGIVVFRHADTIAAGAAVGATITQTGGFFIYTFNDSGTIRWG